MNAPSHRRYRVALGNIATAGLVGALVMLPAGCDPADRFGPIRLDTSPNCAEVRIEVVVPDLNRADRPWLQLISIAMDAPGADSFWALVQLKTPDGGPDGIAVVHVEEGQVQIQLPLDDFAPETTDVTLQSGRLAGEAWLVETGPGSFRLRALDAAFPEAPLRAASGELGWFPGTLARLCEDELGEPGQSCDVTDWDRQFALVEGVPFLVSVAPFSPSASMQVFAARLSPSLAVGEQTQLDFFRKCEDPSPDDLTPCPDADLDVSYPSITVAGVQQDRSETVHHQYMIRERAVQRATVGRELVGLALDLDSDSRLRGLVFSRELDVEIGVGAPQGLGTDGYAAYLLHPIAEGGGKVTRLITDDPDNEVSSERFDTLTPVFDETAQLLQMSRDVAIGTLAEGQWSVTKLFPDAPERSVVTSYTRADDVTVVRDAGRGALLVFQEEDGPDLVRLRCVD